MFDRSFKTALRNGNPDAFRDFFRLLYPRMKGYCRLFVPDLKDAEDIIQDCFMVLWEKRASINPDREVESYLFVILRNHCLNYLNDIRMKNNTISPGLLEVQELQYLYQLDMMEKEEKSLEEQLIILFRESVDELPAKTRLVFKMCKMEGKLQKEVASELGISIKAVEKHIKLAKQRIQSRLVAQYPVMAFLVTFWLK